MNGFSLHIEPPSYSFVIHRELGGGIRACGSPKHGRGILKLWPLIVARRKRLTNTQTRHISNRLHDILPGIEVLNIFFMFNSTENEILTTRSQSCLC